LKGQEAIKWHLKVPYKLMHTII